MSHHSELKMPLIYTTILITIIHICNVMAFKVLEIQGLKVAFTGFFFPISFVLTTALTETYGHQETEKTILMVLLAQSILLLIVPLSVLLPSPQENDVSQHYYNLFGGLWKVFISSNLAVGIAYYFHSLMNSRLKVWLLGRHRFTRFLISNGFAKAILVFISYPINFYGLMDWTSILNICINTWLLKMLFASISLLLIKPLVKLNQYIDNIDIYDINVSYSPLKIYNSDSEGTNMYKQSSSRYYESCFANN